MTYEQPGIKKLTCVYCPYMVIAEYKTHDMKLVKELQAHMAKKHEDILELVPKPDYS